MAFGDVLRGLGSVLNPAVAQEAAQEDAQQRGIAGQVGLMKLKAADRSAKPRIPSKARGAEERQALQRRGRFFWW
jgi:hypothetical protein